MIKLLSIKNYKSIKNLEFPCKKLNVFIGEPNSGKSNIIEALALQSQTIFGDFLSNDIFRYKTIGDLFFDFNINLPIEVKTDNLSTALKFNVNEQGATDNTFQYSYDTNNASMAKTVIMHDGRISGTTTGALPQPDINIYEFRKNRTFNNPYRPHLSSPYGENLPFLLLSNQEHKKWVSEFLRSKGLTLNLKPTENDIVVSKLVNDEIYSYPYSSLSETLQRVIFYTMALKSNTNKTILLDEPETNTFPFYTKFLGESIALDETNQFFVTTHNPYLLLNMIEKSNDIQVFIVQMKNYQTVVTPLNNQQLEEVLDLNSDVFFNFDKILGEE